MPALNATSRKQLKAVFVYSVVAGAILFHALPGFAAVSLCVKVQAPDDGATAGIKRLVLDELGHHPSHAVVAQGCASRLFVEVFEAAGARYLTARINRGIPARYAVKDGADLGETVAKALRLVLDSDPTYLAEDVSRYSAAQRAAHSVLARGHNRLRFEAYEAAAFPDGASFAPGGAVSITRGADNWQISSRVYFGGQPGAAPPTGLALRIHTGGEAGVAYEFNAQGVSTFYVGAGAGVQLVGLEGRAVPSDPGSVDMRLDFGLAAYVRAGARFLRVYDFDCDLFAQSYFPVFIGGDVDSQISRQWSPSVLAGIGVGF